ncbi:matrix protein [Koolpinyah virus]|uniref:Matrix protein n=1 Tax=Koolpinyah virus TaxID=1550518 RepID=A0A096ZGS8_9RHAB|nr:matrix protein [Koolpinyah virus]AIR95560.1 matrix protein [Koolpinyah virus]
MLTLWKKKKNGTPERPTAPLWLSSYEDRYDGAFGAIEETVEVKKAVRINLLTQASLEVISRRPVDSIGSMCKILDAMADVYDGSYLGKACIITSYLILGTHLVKSNRIGIKSNIYKNAFAEVLQFYISGNIEIDIKGVSYKKYFSTFYLGEPVTISFDVMLTPTKRKGKNFLDTYNIPMCNGLMPPSLDGQLESYEIYLKPDDNGVLYLDYDMPQ